MTAVKQEPTTPRNNDEIDLYELWMALYHQKWLIIGCSILFGIATAVYAFTASPLYEIKVGLQLPSKQNISPLNMGRIGHNTLETYDQETVFAEFDKVITSGVFQRSFFEKNLTTLFPETGLLNTAAIDKAWDEFKRNTLKIKQGRRSSSSLKVITFKLSNAKDTKTLLTEFLTKANEQASFNLWRETNQEVENLKKTLKSTYESYSKAIRTNRLNHLKEARENSREAKH
jgi:chain length determinant protein (polysaccharide antigen chain regulator)